MTLCNFCILCCYVRMYACILSMLPIYVCILFYIYRNLDYVCKENGNCIVDVTRRNQCQSCRFKKCLQVNMKKEGLYYGGMNYF